MHNLNGVMNKLHVACIQHASLQYDFISFNLTLVKHCLIPGKQFVKISTQNGHEDGLLQLFCSYYSIVRIIDFHNLDELFSFRLQLVNPISCSKGNIRTNWMEFFPITVRKGTLSLLSIDIKMQLIKLPFQSVSSLHLPTV